MSLPCLQSLLKLIELYRTNRKNKHEHFLEKSMHLAETTWSFFTGQLPTQKQLKHICNLTINRLNKAKTIEDWLDIVYFLGEKAEAAQRLKKLPCCQKNAFECCHKQSLLCEILHAMRNHIVTAISTPSSDNEDNEGMAIYAKRVKELWEVVNRLDEKIKTSPGNYWQVNNNELNKALLKLSFLEDKVAIKRARQLQLLNYLKLLSPKDIKELSDRGYKKQDECYPRCLQEEFYLIVEERLRTQENIVLLPALR